VNPTERENGGFVPHFLSEVSSMTRSPAFRFDFRQRVAYDADRKALFHRRARRQLRLLGDALGFDRGAYDLRCNAGGIAVSGEITLHAEHLYIQASQSALGSDNGILYRRCQHRRDYVGGMNHFTSLDLLHEPEQLARVITQAIGR
jgi:hypothetical protein